MEIAIFSEDFTPYTPSSPIGDYSASLAREFVRLGHGVSLFMPMPRHLDLGRHSLARRLISHTIECNQQDYECIRYDGRTTSGVQAYIVETEGLSNRHGDDHDLKNGLQVFVLGAREILKNLGLKLDWCLTPSAEIAAHLALLKESAGPKSTKMMYLDCEPQGRSSAVSKSLRLADAVVATNLRGDQTSRQKPNDELAQMITAGKATVLPLPAPTADRLDPAEKISSKMTFQIRHGLPVRPNVPVVLFSDRVTSEAPQALRSFLKSDVQAIALKGEDSSLKSLALKYPDRLVLIDRETEADALASADGYVVGNDSSLACMALANGTIPIGGPGIAGDVVDLEPSCHSGSGILLGDLSLPSLKSGLERLTTAYAHEADFRALCSRVQGYVVTWPAVAKYYIQLMTS